ncbi:MAG: DNA repair protein RecN [Saprospiraceae bacterium]
MIKNLRIKNYALIDELNIDFNKGLNIITGETGAGKSILLGSLELVMGKRADTSVLYNKDEKCLVEMELDVKNYALQDFFIENDIDYNDIAVITRIINPNGKSRAFINDTPVTLNILNDLTDQLVLIHKQFDSIKLNNAAYQLNIIDNFADNKDIIIKYKEVFKEYKKASAELDDLLDQKQKFEKDNEYLQFQFDELTGANLNQDVFDEENALLNNLNNAENIKGVLLASYNVLSESENSILGQLEELSRLLNQLSIVDSQFSNSIELFNNSLESLTEVANIHCGIAENTDYDEAKINQLNERIDFINNLIHKYRVADVEGLIKIYDEISQKIDSTLNVDERIEYLKKLIVDLDKKLLDFAVIIKDRRIKSSLVFSKKIEENLKELALPNSKLEVRIEDLNNYTETGKNSVQFYFSANTGSDFKLMKDVASGGELSRLALSIEAVIAGKMSLPTLIFDEIESGISGEVARKMGKILKSISQNHQLINITHSPQIASEGDYHYFVFKNVVGQKTFTNISLLSEEERVLEIAKMLSGDPPTESAIKNAKELINKN